MHETIYTCRCDSRIAQQSPPLSRQDMAVLDPSKSPNIGSSHSGHPAFPRPVSPINSWCSHPPPLFQHRRKRHHSKERTQAW